MKATVQIPSTDAGRDAFENVLKQVTGAETVKFDYGYGYRRGRRQLFFGLLGTRREWRIYRAADINGAACRLWYGGSCGGCGLVLLFTKPRNQPMCNSFIIELLVVNSCRAFVYLLANACTCCLC